MAVLDVVIAVKNRQATRSAAAGGAGSGRGGTGHGVHAGDHALLNHFGSIIFSRTDGARSFLAQQRTEWILRSNDRWLVMYRSHKRLKPEDYRAFVEEASEVLVAPLMLKANARRCINSPSHNIPDYLLQNS